VSSRRRSILGATGSDHGGNHLDGYYSGGGSRFDQNHLGTDHTRDHFREALWLPGRLLDRGGWQGCEHERTIIQKDAMSDSGVARGLRKPLSIPITRQLRAVVSKARQKLV